MILPLQRESSPGWRFLLIFLLVLLNFRQTLHTTSYSGGSYRDLIERESLSAFENALREAVSHVEVFKIQGSSKAVQLHRSHPFLSFLIPTGSKFPEFAPFSSTHESLILGFRHSSFTDGSGSFSLGDSESEGSSFSTSRTRMLLLFGSNSSSSTLADLSNRCVGGDSGKIPCRTDR